jgi:signal transduction histidine kinase
VDRAEGTVTVTVEDDGPGIPAEEVEVLDREVETALQHGSGLGLWIVKWVIERSDASIAFDATDGTRVDITIPER